MKKISILIIAAVAMIACNKTYTEQTVKLNNQADSMNYALGFANGSQIKMMFLRNDSSAKAVAEFVDALQRGYDGKVEELGETESMGYHFGITVKQFEKNGLAENPAITLNEEILFQGLVNGLNQDSTMMTFDAAQICLSAELQKTATLNDSTAHEAGKPITAKCPDKVKQIQLSNNIDSLNYAFGFLNGTGLAQYLAANDSLEDATKEFINSVNKAISLKYEYPQLVFQGEQFGKEIKKMDTTGYFGEANIAADYELFKKGVINGLLGADKQMTLEVAETYLQDVMMNILHADQKEAAAKFLEENGKREGVTTTASGLQYEVIKMGKGEKPTAADRVKVHYHGTLTNGEVFDSSVERGEPISFALTQVIPGWTEALQLMPVGSKFKLYIPHNLGYGSQQQGPIPPFSTLIFEVELLSIEKE
jgi:FKBP-type peptidyl-prolyl cis-trans isomerase FklB